MDPRIRWIGQQLQQHFKVDDYAHIDALFRDHRVYQQLTDFLNGDGVNRLIFFHQILEERDETGEVKELRGVPIISLANPDSDHFIGTAVYFTRTGTNPFVDVASLEADVNFGEIDASLIESMETLLSQVYNPLIAAQQDWGMNSEEGAKEFVSGMRKFVDGLTETVKSLNSGIDLMKPDKKYEVENKQPAFNRAATDPEVLTHYEYVLEEWCKQMEKLVTESDTGRKESEDAGPNTELDYWKTRLSKFNSITEQLKTRECKSVLGVCTAAKSKILRRWKTLDNQITDSANEAKENVKYLTTLEKYIEPLYTGSPASIVDTLPGLLNSIKMMHTVSRYFNTTDRMVSLFSKITNQMISCCKGSINQNGKIWDQDINALIRNFEGCVRLNEAYQEQYRITKDKLLTQPKGKQFDFNEQEIFGKFESFCKRIQKLTDIFQTIQQFSSLEVHKIAGMEAMIARFKVVISDLKKKPYDPLDHNKSNFDRDYIEFNRNIQEIENSLQLFINKSFDTITNTEQALNLLRQFQSILQRENLKSDLDAKYMQVFHNYGVELETVQKIYERNKHSPPMIRNAPPVAGNIMWARQLLRRIEDPMKKFQANKNIMAAKDAKRIVKTYNKVARALIEFETLWHLAWSKSIEAAKSALQATLIIKHPDNGKLYVNFDREILQLIRETKALVRLGIEVPETAKIVLLQEEKFKSYYDQLDFALNEYARVTGKVMPVFKYILKPHTDDIDRKLMPGMTTLTWTSMNIDAYLHRIHSTLAKVEELVTNINEIMESRVERNLKRMSRLVLIDLQESKSYTLNEFVALQDAIIQKRVEIMVSRNTEVKTAMDDIIKLITSYRFDSTSPGEGVDSHEVTALRDHYSKLMYLAILNCVRNSLYALKKRIGSRQSTGFLFVERPFFDVDVELTIPDVSMNPTVIDIQNAINSVSVSILKSTRSLRLWGQPIQGVSHLDTFYDLIARDKAVVRMILLLTGSIEGLKIQVSDFLNSFQQYSYLWKEDMQLAYLDFVQNNPTLDAFEAEMRKYLGVEQQISQISPMHVIGALSLQTQSLKYSLKAEAASWKSQYAKSLHKQAHEDLTQVVRYIDSSFQQLRREIKDLEDLRFIMKKLQEIREKEAEIDLFLAPVEDMYALLSRYEVRVPKEESELISELRPRWKALKQESTNVQEQVQQLQISFKRELIRSVKAFQVDVIQFRNDYDANGPSAVGLKYQEAIERLKFFQRMYDERHRKWETYTAGEELFGLPITDYPELTRTRKELKVLHTVYDLLTDLLGWIMAWSQTTWKDINIESISQKIDECRTQARNFPKQVRDWDATKEVHKTISHYSEMLPILKKLSQPSIRSRHWIQILQINDKSFRHDIDSMTLGMIINCDPINHKEEIDEVVKGAENEQVMELKIRKIEEEWADQVFTFATFKNRGPILLKSKETSDILNLLDESQMSLGTMMTSRYIAPFKEIVTSWMVKLSGVSETIEQLLLVQSMWSYLEAVFSTGDIAKQLPQESKRFVNIDKNWVKLMNKIFETRNVIHACATNDSLRSLLPHLLEQLELCQKSLSEYLEIKRIAFPRFYFVSDPNLLEILSQGTDPNNIQSHFQYLFDNIHFMNVHPTLDKAGNRPIFGLTSFEGEILNFTEKLIPEGRVEEYLIRVEEEIRKTIRIQIRDAARNYPSLSVQEIVEKYIGQVGIIALQLIWSTETLSAIIRSKTEKNILTTTFKKCTNILSELTSMMWRESSSLMKAKLEGLSIVQFHQRDCFEDLIKRKVKEGTDFDWLKQFKMVWKGEMERLEAHILDQEIPYCHEYVGCRERLVNTPLTDRCYIALTQAIGTYMGGAPIGPSGTGKTEGIKDLGRSLGKFFVVFNCSESMEPRSFSKLLKGICRSGAWVILDEFNRVELQVLSVFAQLLQSLFSSMREKKSACIFPDGTSIKPDPRLGVFITMNPGYVSRNELPENMKALFRPVAIIAPDKFTIIRTRLATAGFQDHVNLAKKFQTLYSLCEQQLPRNTYDFGLRNILYILRLISSSRKSAMTANQEAAAIYRIIRDTNVTRLSPEDIPMFLSLLGDIFPSVRVDRIGNEKMEQSLKRQILDSGLMPSPEWIEKITQIYDIASNRSGVAVLGPTVCGKSCGIDMLLKSLSESGASHKQIRVNPKSLSNKALFGAADPVSGDWTDGVITTIWRRALRQKSNFTWIVLDGPIDSTWIENLNTVLDENKFLTLSNGERLPFQNNINILFEAESLANASPTTVTRLGVVFLNESIVGWKLLIDAWFKTRRPMEVAHLSPYFEQHVEALYNILKSGSTFILSLPLPSLVLNMLSLLTSLLPDTTESESVNEYYYEKLFFFALIWSVGASVDNEGRTRVDKYIRQVCDTIPQTTAEESVYDFYVDENSNEWESWSTKLVPLTTPEGNAFNFHDMYIPIPETARITYLSEAYMKRGKSVAIIGPSGAGKTSLMNYYFQKVGDEDRISKILHFSSSIDPIKFQRNLESLTEKRQGRTYGPIGGKSMVLLIEDINVPQPTSKYGNESKSGVDIDAVLGDDDVMETLRQLLEEGGLFSLERMGDFKTFVDINYIATLNPSGNGRYDISSRLKHHFAFVSMNGIPNVTIESIFNTITKHWLSSKNILKDVHNLALRLPKATIVLMGHIRNKLHQTEGRYHYQFNMHDIAKIFSGITLSANSIFRETPFVNLIDLWVHESSRVIQDRLMTLEDREWVRTTIKSVSSEHIDRLFTSELKYPLFYHTKNTSHEAPTKPAALGHSGQSTISMASSSTQLIRPPQIIESPRDIDYQPIKDFPSLTQNFEALCTKFCENENNPILPKVIFEGTIELLVRISRVLNTPRGCMLLVGVGGSGKRLLSHFGSFICGHETFIVPSVKSYNIDAFYFDIKKLFKLAGIHGKHVSFIVPDSATKDIAILEALNSFLGCGELPNLFAKDELDTILNDMRPLAKKSKAGFIDTWDNLYKFFVNRARERIHTIVCLSPVSDSLTQTLRGYPCLMSYCQMDCFTIWPQLAYDNVAFKLLRTMSLDTSAVLLKEMSEFIGRAHNSIEKLTSEYASRYRRHVSITSKNYMNFVGLFQKIYSERVHEIDSQYERTKAGLDKLNQAEVDVEKMKQELQFKEISLQEAQKISTSILSHITEKTAKAEKKKGEVMLVKNELAAEAQRISDEKALCEKDLLLAKPALDDAIQAVRSIQSKDIQSLKAMKNPPELIRRIFDGVLILFRCPLVPIEWVEVKGRQSIKDSYSNSISLMNDVGFLSNIMSYPKDQINDEQIELLEPYLSMEDFNFAEARKVYGSVAGLCKWIRALATYHEQVILVKPKMDALFLAEEKVKGANQNLERALMELEASQAELDSMQAEFDAAMAEKQKIQSFADITRQKISDVNELVLGLLEEKNRWASYSQHFVERKTKLLGDCLVAAAFVNYAGPFNQEYREIILRQHILKECQDRKIPLSDGFDIVEFLTTKSIIRSWIIHGLPNDEQSIQNAIISLYSITPTLFIDPQGQGLKWLKEEKAPLHPKIYSPTDKGLMNGIEESLSAGKQLILENIGDDVDSLIGSMLDISVMKSSREGYHVTFESKDIEFNEDFKLHLVTRSSNPVFSAEVFSKATVIDFCVTPKGLETQLLARVIQKERIDLEEKRIQLLEEAHKYRKRMEDMEEDVLSRLSASKGNLLDDTTLVEALSKIKKASHELREKLDVAANTEKRIETSREEYRGIASRGAVIYFLITELSTINYMYQVSLSEFLNIFDTSIKQAEKVSGVAKRVQSITETLTFNANVFVSRGLFETHKFIWLFMLATRIALAHGSVTPTEYACFLKTGITLSSDPRFNRRKPFDWLPDSTWMGILQLSALPNFDNLSEMISRNEGFWRSWFDQDIPEEIRIPELEDRLTPFQKLLLVRTVREDRTLASSMEFVRVTLGKKYATSNLLDFDTVLADSAARRPVILIVTPGGDPSILVAEAAKKKRTEYSVLSLGQGQDSAARKLVLSEMATGKWVLLQNGYISPKFMLEVENLLLKTPEVHQDFRLFITTIPSPKFPSSLLQMSIKVTNETPQGLKHGLRRTYQLLSQEIVDSALNVEWRSILFSICFLHSVLQERRKFGAIGFSNMYEFNHSDLMASLLYARNHLVEMEQKRAAISWSAMKYTISEILYGGKVTDEYDRRLLMTYCEMWLNKRLTEPNFYFFSPVYTIPRFPEISKIRGAIDDFPNADNPEIFGLHPNADLTYRNSQVRSMLSTLVDVQPKDASMSAQLPNISRDEVLMKPIEEMLAKMPADFIMEDVRDKVNRKLGGPKPINMFLMQEIDRLQAVLTLVRGNLSDLKAALASSAVLSPELTDVSNALSETKIPPAWLKISWSASNLSSWFFGVMQRMEQLVTWLNTGRPISIWLGGFFNPLGFLTSLKQEAVRRKSNWVIEDVVVYVEVLAKEKDEIRVPPEDGYFVHGLYLDGAAWDKKANRLVDLPQRTIYAPLPIAYLTAINVADLKREQTNYSCPCYKSPTRGNANFLLEIDLRCDEDPYKWIMRGVALLTNTS